MIQAPLVSFSSREVMMRDRPGAERPASLPGRLELCPFVGGNWSPGRAPGEPGGRARAGELGRLTERPAKPASGLATDTGRTQNARLLPLVEKCPALWRARRDSNS